MTDSTKRSKPYLLGVAGGSGSGKTFFARAHRQQLGAHVCELVYQDNFYIDQSARFDRDGGSVNFDHPEAIDFALLAECLTSLKEGKRTTIPVYDFVTHSRAVNGITVEPRPIVLVDGILIFHSPLVRDLFDERVFFDTPEEIRFQRRLERDVKERGRKPDGVRAQFLSQVKPMHDQFVVPSKSFAGRVVCDQGEFSLALKDTSARLQKLLGVF
ncbi:MAG: uridine kinase [Bdellovibrionota bacterium]